MSYPAYPEYKDSGVEWLGEVPAHWDVVKLKRLCHMQSGDFISPSDIEEDGEYPVYGGNGHRGFTSSYTHYGLYPLVGRQGALCGNVNYAKGKFWASEHAVVASPDGEVSPVWLGELLRAMDLNQYSITAAQPGLAVEKIKNLFTPKPPLSEQSQIAAFLDHETARIDALVEQQQRLIALLKEKRQAVISHAVTKGLDPDVPMKDSEVEWLGEVPLHWESLPLKHLVREPLKYGANESAEDNNTAHPRFIRITDVARDGSLRDETFRSLPPNVAKQYLLEEGDILLARSGATVGKSFIYKDSWGKCCFAGYLIRARIDFRKALPEFVYFSLQSHGYWQYIGQQQIQATIQNVSAERYDNYVISAPPVDEQAHIVAHLNQYLGDYSKLLETAKQAISLLLERRSALISATVTGKIDVRGWQPPEGAEAKETSQQEAV